MMWFARYFLVFCTGVTIFVASMLGGQARVLCIGGAGHVALEPVHDCGGCPAEHDRHGSPAGSHGSSGGCNDVSADVNLARETSVCPLDLQLALHFLPPVVGDRAARTAFDGPPVARADWAARPPDPGDLARLGGIVLLI